MTLLENILKVDNQSGGTIHQYITDYGNVNSLKFTEALRRDYHQHGCAISYGTIQHYADKYSVHINWSPATHAFYEHLH